MPVVRIRGGLRGFLTAIDGGLDPDLPEPEELAFTKARRVTERLAGARRAHRRAKDASRAADRPPF